ncbi:MAG: hypothetical protein AAGJ97_08975, partial [Planctomycetota bacterium]
GAAALAGSPTVYLLAGLIGLQNLPEGFATYESMRGQGGGGSKRLWVLLSVAPFAGPLAAWLGYRLFADSDAALGGLILACGGGILFLIFDDIAPKAKLKNEDFPALGAVLGYLSRPRRSHADGLTARRLHSAKKASIASISSSFASSNT